MPTTVLLHPRDLLKDIKIQGETDLFKEGRGLPGKITLRSPLGPAFLFTQDHKGLQLHGR